MKEIFKGKINYIFKNIDIFGYIPSLSIKNQLFYQTFFGGLLTLLIVLLAIITLIFFSQELFHRNSPSVNLSMEALNHPQRLNYFDNFEFLIGIQNSSYMTEINEKIFGAKGTLFKTILNESGTYNIKTDLNLISCDIALSNSKNKELYSDLNLQGYYCLSNDQNEEPYIQEHWGNNEFSMIQIKFVDCNNKTGNCASEEEIYDFLHSADLSFYMIDNLVSTKNYGNPFSKVIKEKTLKVSDSYKVSIIQYLRHVRIESDDGLLFTTNHSKSSFALSDFTQDIVFDRDSSTFLTLSIELDNTLQKYQRKYYKLQDLAAQVGGVVNACFVVVALILKLYEKNSYFEYLINNFFEVRLGEFQKTIKLKSYRNNIHEKKNSCNETMKTANTNTNTNTNSNSNGNNNNNVNNNNETITSDKKRKIEFSFLDKLILLKLAPKLSKARKEKIDEIFFKGSEYVMNNLNVITFLKRSHADEMQTKLLMGEEQKKIFDYISKPILSLSFLGSRYNLRNLPVKIKQKLLSRTIIGQIKEKELIDDYDENKKKKRKNKYIQEKYSEDMSQSD